MARSLVSCLVPCALITQLAACTQQPDAPPAHATVVDRTEGDWAVIQHLKDGRIEQVPRSSLPADVRDGDVLVRNQRTAELRELLLHGQRALRSSASHGSFSLEDPPASHASTGAASQRDHRAPARTEVTQALTAEGER